MLLEVQDWVEEDQHLDREIRKCVINAAAATSPHFSRPTEKIMTRQHSLSKWSLAYKTVAPNHPEDTIPLMHSITSTSVWGFGTAGLRQRADFGHNLRSKRRRNK